MTPKTALAWRRAVKIYVNRRADIGAYISVLTRVKGAVVPPQQSRRSIQCLC